MADATGMCLTYPINEAAITRWGERQCCTRVALARTVVPSPAAGQQWVLLGSLSIPCRAVPATSELKTPAWKPRNKPLSARSYGGSLGEREKLDFRSFRGYSKATLGRTQMNVSTKTPGLWAN